ncbi:MAG: hypothetical protein O3A00_27040, partial [Planctomycetota bacterium]|nr:hypothetical protein [Planctomycetota bacterium]
SLENQTRTPTPIQFPIEEAESRPFDDATAESPHLTWTELAAMGWQPGELRYITLLVTDDLGNTDTDSAAVLVGDVIGPVADAGGDYFVTPSDMMGGLNLDGSMSYHLDGVIVSYQWDLDGDGDFDDASGEWAWVSWSELVVLGWEPGESRVIGLLVTDALGNTGTDSAVVQVGDSIAPVGEAGGDYFVMADEMMGFLDVDGSMSYATSGMIVSFDWDLDGDGEFDDASGEFVTVSWTELAAMGWLEGEIRQISLRVTDDSGDTGIDTAHVTVQSGSYAMGGDGPESGTTSPSGTTGSGELMAVDPPMMDDVFAVLDSAPSFGPDVPPADLVHDNLLELALDYNGQVGVAVLAV